MNVIGDTGLVTAGLIVAGGMTESIAFEGSYPLDRNFDHRIAIELDCGGMPIVPTVIWNNEKRRQEIAHVLGTFPLVNTYKSEIKLDRHGANIGDVEVSQNLTSGTIVFRRAEDKIVERFEVKNSSFFQNILLRLYIQVKKFNTRTYEYETLRRPLLLGKGDLWSAKLRFRTL